MVHVVLQWIGLDEIGFDHLNYKIKGGCLGYVQFAETNLVALLNRVLQTLKVVGRNRLVDGLENQASYRVIHWRLLLPGVAERSQAADSAER